MNRPRQLVHVRIRADLRASLRRLIKAHTGENLMLGPLLDRAMSTAISLLGRDNAAAIAAAGKLTSDADARADAADPGELRIVLSTRDTEFAAQAMAAAKLAGCSDVADLARRSLGQSVADILKAVQGQAPAMGIVVPPTDPATRRHVEH